MVYVTDRAYSVKVGLQEESGWQDGARKSNLDLNDKGSSRRHTL